MGCAPGMQTPLTTTREAPLRFRFLLYVHRGPADPAKIEPVARDFAARPNLGIKPSPGKNRQFGLEQRPG